MDVSLKYGDSRVDLRVPDARFAGHWHLGSAVAAAGGGADPWGRALGELGAAGFADAVRGRIVGLMVADGTRSWDPDLLLPGVLGALAAARGVRVVVCTGTHDPAIPETRTLVARIEAQLARTAVPAELIVHDARAQPHTDFGRTRLGTRVEILDRVGECEAFLVLADMKPHFFAGYSNPVKYFVPGVASRETARGNHSLVLEQGSTFGRHPWHPDPDRRRNPLAEDMVEALGRVLGPRPCFALVSFTAGDALLWAAGGEAREAAARGMVEVDRRAGLEIPAQRFLVVSPGGDPHDESFYTAQRALELSLAATRAGGEVLFLVRCPNGIGPPAARERFFEPLTRPLGEIVAAPRDEYVLYSHKPVKFARYLERLAALHVLSELPDEEIRRVHMHPVADPQGILDRWVAAAAPGEGIGFLDDASKLAVRAPGGAGGNPGAA